MIERPARPFAAAEELTVFVVDDDESMREALRSLFRSVKLKVETFGSTADFLRSKLADVASCLVLDVRLPGLNGLDFQDELVESNVDLPVVFITGHGDVTMSVRAIKAGAVDFLMKPFRHQDVIDAIYSAIERHRLRRKAEATALELSNRFALLTSRERQVMLEVVGGRPNKQIAARLKISEFTVKVHRSHLMHKMKARTLVDLVRMADKLLWRGRVIVGRPLRDTIAPI